MANKWEGGSRPTILNITVPQVKKIKQPSKYYVYKLIVEWSNGHKETIYRRYSQFFDFQAKLHDLIHSLENTNGLLPELPGKVLFGRSQVHQVAEKRRVKIEEFCQAVYRLPPAVSESSHVQGFFSIWPIDTESNNSNTGCTIVVSSETSPSITSPTISPEYEMWSNSIFDVPMNDELPQYCVVEDYEKKDSQQVNLFEGQTVSVIERCDTGWWMVLAGDEQGYAPASLLDPIDGSSTAEEDVFNDQEGLYEAVDMYEAKNQDEISVKPGDTIQVINRSMDGWWEINSGGKTGYVPGSVMRKSSTVKMMSKLPSVSQMYCNDIRAFHPPPRRCKAGKTFDGWYDVPRKDKLAVKTANGSDDDPDAIYSIPRRTSSDSDGPVDSEQDNTPQRNGHLFSDHIYEMDMDALPQDQERNQTVKKKKPLIPQSKSKKMIKSESDAIAGSRRHKATTESTVRSRAHTTAAAYNKPDDEDYIQMESVNDSPVDLKGALATGKKPAVASKPLSSSRRVQPTSPGNSQLSPLLNRVARSHSFDNILDISTSTDWALRRSSPKASRKASLEGVHSNTNASNNSKASNGEDQTDYIDLSGKPDSSVTLESFTAVAGYVAQSDICLSFSAGTCCVLLRKTDQNWWLVHIGGKEGWVPGSYWELSTQQMASKFANPPSFPAPQGPIYANHSVYKRPLVQTTSSPNSPCLEKSRRPPPPKPRALPDDLAADIRLPRRLQSAKPDDIVRPVTPTRYASLHSTSSRGSTPDSDIIPVTVPKRPSNEYQNTDDIQYQNTDDLLSLSTSSLDQNRTSPPHGRTYEQRPLIPNRGRFDVNSSTMHERRLPLVASRDRAETFGDVLSSPPAPKPRSATVVTHSKKQHDYEEIKDELGQQAWFYGPMDRESAEALLKEHGRQSEFLVRERRNRNGYFAVSIKNHLNVRHFNIDPDPSTNSYIMGTIKFKTIFEIIHYYQENSLFLQNGVAVSLGQPVRRRSRLESSIRKS